MIAWYWLLPVGFISFFVGGYLAMIVVSAYGPIHPHSEETEEKETHVEPVATSRLS